MHSNNQFTYSRERRRFGRALYFVDRTQLTLSILPTHNQRLSFIRRNPVNCETQFSDQKAFSEMETDNVLLGHHGMHHIEGGWPRELNPNDEEQVIRHRKKIEREDTWGVQVSHLIRNARTLALQNAAINIYQHYFAELPTELCANLRTSFEARKANIFRDPVRPCRPIAITDWTPNKITHFLSVHTDSQAIDIENERSSASINVRISSIAVASSAHALETSGSHNANVGAPSAYSFAHALSGINVNAVQSSENSYFLWSLMNPIKPLTVFECSEPIRKAFYCPKDDFYIAGGSNSGKVMIWDSRTGQMPIEICPLEVAHRDTVSALCWVHSKTNTEFYTGSQDGSIKYWDRRNLMEPAMELFLDPEAEDKQLRERAHGVAVLEFEYTIPVRYIIASDFGHVFVANRKAVTPIEILLSNYKLFAGPIRTIERNPFFVKNFLIVGDWCAKIWAEEVKGSPTTLTVKKQNQMTCGTWSNTRCSLFVTGDEKGELDFWDLLLNQRKPIYTIKFGKRITHIKFRSDGQYLAVGTENGDAHMLELDDAMKHSGPKDKALIAAMFERELLRSKLLEARFDEIKLRQQTDIWDKEKLLKERQSLRSSFQSLADINSIDIIHIIEADEGLRKALQHFREIIYEVERKRDKRVFVFEKTDFESELSMTQSMAELFNARNTVNTIDTIYN